ncbi:MAG: hypothetical protein AAF050_15205 [Cyanobacteria bacterium J06649_5]
MVSVRLSPSGKEIMSTKIVAKGWTQLSHQFQDESAVSESTLKRFWQGKKVRVSTFFAIAKAAGVEDWKSLAEPDDIVDLPDGLIAIAPEPLAIILTARFEADDEVEIKLLSEDLCELMLGASKVKIREHSKGLRIVYVNGIFLPSNRPDIEHILTHLDSILEKPYRRTIIDTTTITTLSQPKNKQVG